MKTFKIWGARFFSPFYYFSWLSLLVASHRAAFQPATLHITVMIANEPVVVTYANPAVKRLYGSYSHFQLQTSYFRGIQH